MERENKKENKEIRITIRLYPEQYKAIEKLSTEEGKNFSEVIREAIYYFIQEKEGIAEFNIRFPANYKKELIDYVSKFFAEKGIREAKDSSDNMDIRRK